MTAKAPTSIAVGLTTPEHLLLFCLASGADWQAANIAQATARQMTIRGLIERETGATSYRLTDQGRAVLDALQAGASDSPGR